MATKADPSSISFDPRYDVIEDRLEHVEKEIRQLREEISRPGILTLPEAALFSLKAPAAGASAADAGEVPPLQAILLWLLDIARWLVSTSGRLLRFCLVPWVRNVVFGLLSVAILFSDWWLPFSSIWILGALWERSVILVLAGLWWWLLAMYFADRPKKSLAGPAAVSQGSRKPDKEHSTVRPAGERFGARAG